jgi:hypothetical protein
MTEREAVARDLATMLGKDRWVPATAHIVLLIIVLLDAGTGLPRAFKLTWATAIIATILLRTILAARAQRPDTDPVTTVRITRALMVTLGLTWGVGAALAARYLPPAIFAMLLMALAGLLAGGINTLVADRWAFPVYALSLFGPTLVALPLLNPQPATSLEMVLIALFLFFMIVQHRRAHDMLVDRQVADQNQRTLVRELQAAVAEVRTLQGILPICASCKRIKNEAGRWEAVESFVRERTDAEFSHGLCPDCAARDWGAAPNIHRASP